jgi:hypothetical protein
MESWRRGELEEEGGESRGLCSVMSPCAVSYGFMASPGLCQGTVGPAITPITAVENVGSWEAAQARHVSQAWQAPMGPRRFAFAYKPPASPSRARGLLSAQWKPGYHGPGLHRPTTLYKRFHQVSLGRPPEAGSLERASPGPREDLSLERPSSTAEIRLSQDVEAHPLARTPSRDSLVRSEALHPLQSAHGLCARHRVTRVTGHGDAHAAVASFVPKVVNKAAPSKADYKNCHFRAKGTVARYEPSQRHRGARRRALRAQAYRPLAGGFSARKDKLSCHGPGPWTRSWPCTVLHLCRHVVALPAQGQ